jgi:hypothetical protein
MVRSICSSFLVSIAVFPLLCAEPFSGAPFCLCLYCPCRPYLFLLDRKRMLSRACIYSNRILRGPFASNPRQPRHVRRTSAGVKNRPVNSCQVLWNQRQTVCCRRSSIHEIPHAPLHTSDTRAGRHQDVPGGVGQGPESALMARPDQVTQIMPYQLRPRVSIIRRHPASLARTCQISNT